MEENRRFSFTNLFIKIIIVIIFVLFTVWLLSLSNNGLSNSLDVLTNNIFSQNIEKMKEVGKEYFTTERLPQKLGEVKTLTLAEMYEKKLLLELTDKFGNACSSKNSYVSVEKYDDEYQMKVYLECGKDSDYIIVIMGCYDYCDTDICEKVSKEEIAKEIEYQYVKTTGGKWTDYGNWSEWSKVSVNNTDYRQIETKRELEQYTYDKATTDYEYTSIIASCPEGYKKSADGLNCYKEVTTNDTKNPTCPTVNGYTLVSQNGFDCTYSRKVTVSTVGDATCIDGYTLKNGNCVKTVTETVTKTASCPTGYVKSGSVCIEKADTKNPTCPTVSGYNLVSRDGFTCNYSKTTNDTKNPTCPTVSGYTMYERNGFTCHYRKYIKGDYVRTETGEVVPGNTTSYIYEEVGSAEYVYDCKNSCAFRWIHTWKVYKAKVETTTKTATCPAGYSQNGSVCSKGKTETITKTATCPTGYEKSENVCAKTNLTTKTPVCPTVSGYTKTSQNGFTCNYSKTTNDIKDPVCWKKEGWTFQGRDGLVCNYSKVVTESKVDSGICPTGYTKNGDSCIKQIVNYNYQDLIKTCPVDYTKTKDGTECYKEVTSTIKVTEDREVTYYRYRIREYIGGSTDYKWSKSKNDKKLLDAGYKLTGKTR